MCDERGVCFLTMALTMARPPSRLRIVALGVLSCAATLALASAAVAATVSRGPYLQRGTASTAIVRWRTVEAVSGRVAWGLAPAVLDHLVDEAAFTTEHRVQLAGLPADSVVYYAVAAVGELPVGSADLVFRTAPPPDTARTLRFLAAGDCGAASDPGDSNGLANAVAVRDGYLAWAGGAAPDGWLLLGDNAYLSGTDTEYQTALFDVYPPLLERTFLWPALGNHDAFSSDSPTQTGPFFASFSLPRQAEAGGLASGTEAYYAFDWGPVHVVVLDSADSDLTAGGAMLTWLDADLAATRQRWRIALWHHPPYTKGSHDSDNDLDSDGRMGIMRTRVLPILERRGVHLVLTGHSHAYERSWLTAGHYGASPTFDAPTMVRQAGDGRPDGDGAYRVGGGERRGTVYVVAGTGSRPGVGPLGHPATAVGSLALGSLAIDVTGDHLDGRFIGADGSVLDWFELVDVTLAADGFESGTLAGWSTVSP
jgi:hypothetical protein